VFLDILVAVDGSAHARRAVTEASDLARATNARLTVITVVPDPRAWVLSGTFAAPVDMEALREAATTEHRKLLTDAVAAVPEEVHAREVLAHGQPARAIVDQVESGSHDLVVIGSRGRGGVRALMLGSVSHQVLHTCPVPVLLDHDEADGSA
jgi:nucleotide-binding universal stress UspA family protein